VKAIPPYMKYIISFVCFLIITISGFSQKKSPKIKTYIEDTGNIRPIIKNIVDQIVEYNSVDAKSTGVAGSESTQYKRFLQLIQQADSREMVQLTNHPSATIRAYAFWALGKREYKSIIPDIVTPHLNDRGSFTYLSGCEPETEQINTFYLHTLMHSPDFNYLRLSKKEKEKYNKLLIDMRK